MEPPSRCRHTYTMLPLKQSFYPRLHVTLSHEGRPQKPTSTLPTVQSLTPWLPSPGCLPIYGVLARLCSFHRSLACPHRGVT